MGAVDTWALVPRGGCVWIAGALLLTQVSQNSYAGIPKLTQSTGKSTLLNLLFGTEFGVMREDRRQQTTRGIWAASDSSNILVLDVEGTDGRERGDDQDFERKSAVFSLSLAEVLIVNMWEAMVGLYNGANLGLLRTVFEANLLLFQLESSPKTALVFVIRDFTNTVPLDTLAETLTADLLAIWAALPKPQGKETAEIVDFFVLSFQGIPHKLYAQQGFETEINQLKSRFYDSAHPQYLLNPEYHKGIPADGFPKFADSIWEKIVTNKNLDLPSQQTMLAKYRCEEILKVC